MRVAVVGSRSFPQLDNVRWFVNELPEGVIVVSGGAHGVDTAAAQAARAGWSEGQARIHEGLLRT